MCNGYKPVKAPAKKITDTNGQSEVNQSQHTQILADLLVSTRLRTSRLRPAVSGLRRANGFGVAGIGANPKRAISSVKHAQEIFDQI
jgi:hypothetical protein